MDGALGDMGVGNWVLGFEVFFSKELVVQF